MALFDVRPLRSPGRPRRAQVPAGFQALADALTQGGDPVVAAQEIGRRTAAEGIALDDLMHELGATYEAVLGVPDPSFAVVRAAAAAWADGALRYLHAVSCEDPLTGLSSLSHVRTRLVEMYRAGSRDGVTGAPGWALVVVELEAADTATRFDRELRLVDLADQLRSVYSGDETLGRLTGRRAVALVRRDRHLGGSVAALRALLGHWQQRGGPSARVWIEGLPAGADAAEALLDELAR